MEPVLEFEHKPGSFTDFQPLVLALLFGLVSNVLRK